MRADVLLSEHNHSRGNRRASHARDGEELGHALGVGLSLDDELLGLELDVDVVCRREDSVGD